MSKWIPIAMLCATAATAQPTDDDAMQWLAVMYPGSTVQSNAPGRWTVYDGARKHFGEREGDDVVVRESGGGLSRVGYGPAVRRSDGTGGTLFRSGSSWVFRTSTNQFEAVSTGSGYTSQPSSTLL